MSTANSQAKRRARVEMRMSQQLFLGFIRVHILHHAGLEPVSGVDLMEELASHGYQLSPGTIYPVLHSLQSAGYLRVRSIVENGRRRKYYVLTDAGRHALGIARKRIRELVEEVL